MATLTPTFWPWRKSFPTCSFSTAGGLYQEGVHPNNVGSYFGFIDEAQYVAGIVAAHIKPGKLGFVVAKPIPRTVAQRQQLYPGGTLYQPRGHHPGDFHRRLVGDPVKEAEATNSMADQGVEVITCHVDSPKVVMETAEKRGYLLAATTPTRAAVAPKGYLTGAEWDWTSVYTKLWPRDLWRVRP